MKASSLRAVLVTLITSSASAALAQEPPLILPAPPPLEAPAPREAPEPAPFNSLELQLGAGVSVATIHVDGAAQTGFLPSVAAAFHRGMLVAGLRFDPDPSSTTAATATAAAEERSGWHLGAFVGPSFALTERLRLDLNAEVGVHRAQDTLVQPRATYATSASLPYLGFRPAVSVQFGAGKYTGAIGVAAFLRIDASQKQSNGLPDDGGHQLGLEIFASLRLALL
jgi:hypothetical protein